MKIMKTNIVNYFNEIDYSDTINKVLTKAGNLLNQQNAQINIILVNNDKIKELNKVYRNKDHVTDVLTFPDGEFNNLGDVFISIQKCTEQAVELGHSFNRELGFLTIHGFLHTIGYDHHTDDEEKIMNDMQNKVLNAVKLYR